MAEIYNFNNNENEEDCKCPFCQLASEFTSYVLDAETPDEVFDILRDLVGESSKLGLIQYLQREIEINVEFVDHLINGCDCEDDE